MSSSTTRSKKEQPFLLHVAESIGSTRTMVAKTKVARKAANRSGVVRAAKRRGRKAVRKSEIVARKGERIVRKSARVARQTTRRAVAGRAQLFYR